MNPPGGAGGRGLDSNLGVARAFLTPKGPFTLNC